MTLKKKTRTHRADRLTPRAGRHPKDDASFAFAGAEYHLKQLAELFDAGLIDFRDINQFHWHLRAFFWGTRGGQGFRFTQAGTIQP